LFDASLGRGATETPGGSIATSEATQRLCEGYFEFRARGPTALKGLHATVEVYEVVRAGPLRSHFQLSTRRGLTKFVGREREMEALKHAAARARSGRARYEPGEPCAAELHHCMTSVIVIGLENFGSEEFQTPAQGCVPQ
jgi:hypothetical protein